VWPTEGDEGEGPKIACNVRDLGHHYEIQSYLCPRSHSAQRNRQLFRLPWERGQEVSKCQNVWEPSIHPSTSHRVLVLVLLATGTTVSNWDYC